MKLYHFAAATLLMGTSALAWQPEPQSPEAVIAAVEAKDGEAETSQQMKKAVNDVLAQAVTPKPQPVAAVTDPEAADPVATAEVAPAAIATLDLATRPATQDYPPCNPGPGDDNCIQLYEPGVRTALAGWNRPTGGLMDGQAAETAMGGPYEPVAAESAGMAMDGDGVIDPASGEIA